MVNILNVEEPKWIQLPSGLHISDNRLKTDGRWLNSFVIADMDIEEFNKNADEYDIRIEEKDVPAKRMLKYCEFLSRKNNYNSFIPTKNEYDDMVLDVITEKNTGKSEFTEFYKIINAEFNDMTREVLRINKISPEDRYKVTLLRFNKNCELEPVRSMFIKMKHGWIKELNDHGYPIEISDNECSIENINKPGLAYDVTGMCYVNKEINEGDKFLVLRNPNDNRALDMNISIDFSRPYFSVTTFLMKKTEKASYTPSSSSYH